MGEGAAGRLIRLLTLNTWKDEGDYDRRMALMVEGLGVIRPDILCLQEVYADDTGSRSTAATLQTALGLQAFVTPSRVKRRHGRVSSSGLCLLSAWPFQSTDVLALPSDPTDGDRIAQSADLITPLGPLRVINLHLTHLQGPSAARLRSLQLDAICKRAIQDWTGPIVFAGDFNATPDATELVQVLHKPRAQCSAALLAEDSSLIAGPRKMIDLVVLWRAASLTLNAARTALGDLDGDGVSASDHKAIIVELTALGSARGQDDVTV